MAILVNMGQRGFVLKEGFLAPGKELVVDRETGEKLAAIYKTELKLIKTETIVEEVKVEAPVEVKEECEAPKEELKQDKPVKRGRKKAQK